MLDPLNRSKAIEKVWQILANKFKSGRISTNAKLAVLNVEELVTFVHKESGYLLEVIYEPEDNDSSHCGIHNLPREDEKAMLVGELIAEKVLELNNFTDRIEIKSS